MVYETELTHHGILGMRWGVRRYQNKDGTLTAKGKKRYNSEMEKLKQEEKVLKNKQRTQNKLNKLDAKKQEIENLKRKVSGKDDETETAKTVTKSLEKPKPKKISEMTDEEIINKINRLRLEKTLKELSPEELSRGEKFTNEVLMPAGKSLVNKAKDSLGDAISKKIKEAFGIDEDDMSKLKKQAEKAGFEKTIAEAEAAIKKAKGEDVDKEYESMKRESEMAGFRTKIRNDKKNERNYRQERTSNLFKKYKIKKNASPDDTSMSSYESEGESIVQGLLYPPGLPAPRDDD